MILRLRDVVRSIYYVRIPAVVLLIAGPHSALKVPHLLVARLPAAVPPVPVALGRVEVGIAPAVANPPPFGRAPRLVDAGVRRIEAVESERSVPLDVVGGLEVAPEQTCGIAALAAAVAEVVAARGRVVGALGVAGAVPRKDGSGTQQPWSAWTGDVPSGQSSDEDDRVNSGTTAWGAGVGPGVSASSEDDCRCPPKKKSKKLFGSSSSSSSAGGSVCSVTAEECIPIPDGGTGHSIAAKQKVPGAHGASLQVGTVPDPHSARMSSLFVPQ